MKFKKTAYLIQMKLIIDYCQYSLDDCQIKRRWMVPANDDLLWYFSNTHN